MCCVVTGYRWPGLGVRGIGRVQAEVNPGLLDIVVGAANALVQALEFVEGVLIVAVAGDGFLRVCDFGRVGSDVGSYAGARLGVAVDGANGVERVDDVKLGLAVVGVGVPPVFGACAVIVGQVEQDLAADCAIGLGVSEGLR